MADNRIEIDDTLLRRWPLPAPGDGGKEERGLVLIVAGSPETPGAAVLAATAALRAGAGKVTIATPASIAQAVALAVPESRVIALEETGDGAIKASAARVLEELADKVASVLIGPGLAEQSSTRVLTSAVLDMFPRAGIILDAAAMDIAMASRGEIPFSNPVLLTPHAGEMAKLRDSQKETVEAHPEGASRSAAQEWNAVVALKGAITHIAAPDQRVWRHQGGNAGLAISGSGDVLAGIIAGLIARGASLEQAAAWGVALHARAGEKLAERYGPLGYLARELAAEVPGIMAGLGN